MANDESRIEGMDELIARLDDLTLVQSKNILARSLRQGGLLIAEEAEHQAPTRTGRLAANIVVAVQDQTASHAVARIGPAKSVFYGKFPEFGTAHQTSNPWMRPAYEAKITEALAVIAYDLERFILKAVKKK